MHLHLKNIKITFCKNKKSVVYKCTCGSCPKVYLSQTGRSFIKFSSEHRDCFINETKDSKYTEHSITENQIFNYILSRYTLPFSLILNYFSASQTHCCRNRLQFEKLEITKRFSALWKGFRLGNGTVSTFFWLRGSRKRWRGSNIERVLNEWSHKSLQHHANLSYYEISYF